ncbi:MAG: hypothetical protein HOL40_06575 [Cellvibrionales bacterium]|nr:hypothetical protein [Cellvibrionales bacterium]
MFEFWFAVLIMSAVIVITGVMFARSKPHLSKPHRSKSATSIDDSVASARVADNVRLYQQRLSELDQLLAVSDIDAQAHSSLVLEARSQLIVDLNNPSSLKPDDDIEQWIQQLIQELEQQAIPQADEASGESHSGRGILWAAGLSIPLLALAIYLPQGLSIGGSLEWQVAEHLGTLNSTTDARQRQQQLLTVTQLLEQRASLSRSKPELLQLQAEIYSAMNQHRDAANVYSALLERNTENAAVTALLAQSLYLLDAETASANTSAAALMSQRVRELLSSALRLDPQQHLALSMSGMQAFSEADYPNAIRYWGAAKLAYGESSPQAASIDAGIQAAQARLAAQANQNNSNAVSDKPSQTTAHIRVRVSIDPAQRLASDNPDTPVFVFARAVEGSRMPLAAKRLKLSDLPTELLLTENDKMMAQSIAGQEILIVGARLARSGQPIAEAGDSQSREAITKVEAKADDALLVELVIDQRQQ